MTLERLGESRDFGYTLLELLGLSGWQVVVTTPFAGAAVDEADAPIENEHAAILVIAEKGGHVIHRTGESVAAIACDVFQECARRQRIRVVGDVQLKLS